MDAEDLPINGETPLKKDRETKYTNMEHNRWLLNAKDCLRPDSCVVPRTLYPGTSPVLPGNDDDTCAEPSGTLEKMNHVATGSSVLENRRREVHYETGIPEYNENAERHFFPMERQPVTSIHLVDRSMPWKMHPVEQNRLHDRAPNLELALGAEIKPLTQGRSFSVGKVDKKSNEEHIFHEAGTNTEDDLSASLSLSLAFPFQ
ncbi:hypothetical protein Pfo_030347 [Paulownia fortunei]|nr:hypothetical protein Pfo_030347 [Paulownia fortunei]